MWSRAYLASEDMEVVCRGGAVDHLPVDALCCRPQVTPREPLALINGGCVVGVLISHLQEPLYPTAAVLRTLRQQVIQLRVVTGPILLMDKDEWDLLQPSVRVIYILQRLSTERYKRAATKEGTVDDASLHMQQRFRQLRTQI